MKNLFNNQSSGLAALIDLLKPRYIYSSQLDIHHKRLPFKVGNHLCRFIALGSLPGKHKQEESKQVYIQAIELEPISTIDMKELTNIDCEHSASPYLEFL